MGRFFALCVNSYHKIDVLRKIPNNVLAVEYIDEYLEVKYIIVVKFQAKKTKTTNYSFLTPLG